MQLCVIRKPYAGADQKCAFIRKPCAGADQKEETRTSKMQHADLHQRIKLRAYLLWERKGSPRDERRSTGCALRRRWRVSTLAGGGAPRDARHRRPYYDGAADQIARAHLPGVRGDRAPRSEPM